MLLNHLQQTLSANIGQGNAAGFNKLQSLVNIFTHLDAEFRGLVIFSERFISDNFQQLN